MSWATLHPNHPISFKLCFPLFGNSHKKYEWVIVLSIRFNIGIRFCATAHSSTLGAEAKNNNRMKL